MAWTGLVLTVEGRNALNEAQLSGSMRIKAAAVGDGAPPANFQTQKGLVHQLYAVTELKIDRTENGCTVTADFPEVEYDYYFREIGILIDTDQGEKLYVYDNCGEDAQYIVSSTGVEKTRKRLRLSLVITDVPEITVANPGILYVAYDDFEAAVQEMHESLSDHADNKDNPHHVTKEQMGLGNVDNTSDADKPVSAAQQAALDAAREASAEALASHTGNKTNPHKVTKGQVGLGNADNTSDADKPVSAAQQAALDTYYEQLAAYVRQKIADLVGGAPAAMDTLKELADALAAHKSVMDALDAAIGKKANAAEFDSHVKDAVKHITASERTKWNSKADKTGMSGATASAAGASGLVPAPGAGAANRYLRSDGTWQVPPDNNTVYSHPTTSGNRHIPAGGTSGQILRWSADGTAIWGADNNTTYGNMTAATAGAAGKAGLVPAPPSGAQGKYLTGGAAYQNVDDHAAVFTGGDALNPTVWTDVPAMQSGETHKSLFGKISTMFRNVRYLWKVMGSADISAIGDGTVTGALSTLNTGLLNIARHSKVLYDGSSHEIKPTSNYQALVTSSIVQCTFLVFEVFTSLSIGNRQTSILPLLAMLNGVPACVYSSPDATIPFQASFVVDADSISIFVAGNPIRARIFGIF